MWARPLAEICGATPAGSLLAVWERSIGSTAGWHTGMIGSTSTPDSTIACSFGVGCGSSVTGTF